MKKGFTLIELLAVVMIIGILAAAAVPQYRKVVEKARITEGLVVLKALADAQQRYLQANPGRSGVMKKIEVADVDLKGGQWWISGGNIPDRYATDRFVYVLGGDGRITGVRVDYPQESQQSYPDAKYTITYNATGGRTCSPASSTYDYICTMFNYM